MPTIGLKYGRTEIPFDYDAERFRVLGADETRAPLSDAEIGARLDAPIGSPVLEEIVGDGDSVLIVVPDATRATASAQIVNLLVRRLIANGTMPFNIRIIFATGIHRKVTEDEKRSLITPFIFQRITTLDHDARDLMKLAGLESDRFATFGEIDGVAVELNRALVEFDRVIIVGGVSFHYFAGFTGGRKLICPGLASEATIAATHRLAFDFETKSRRRGVGAGKLDGNAVHEAFTEICGRVAPAFAVTTIVDETGAAVDVFAGDWRESHRAACDVYAAGHTVEIEEKRDLVVVSCGGAPHDLNMIQAHKALETASAACTDGGTIVLLAECTDGPGRKDFLEWFTARSSEELAENLCRDYKVNGQTAWSLLKKAERFDIRILSSLPESQTEVMRLGKLANHEIGRISSRFDGGYIIPYGAKFSIASERSGEPKD